MMIQRRTIRKGDDFKAVITMKEAGGAPIDATTQRFKFIYRDVYGNGYEVSFDGTVRKNCYVEDGNLVALFEDYDLVNCVLKREEYYWTDDPAFSDGRWDYGQTYMTDIELTRDGGVKEVEQETVPPTGGVCVNETIAISKGDPGESAYEIAVRDGFEGTEQEWLASLKGKDGKPGIPGAPGMPAVISSATAKTGEPGTEVQVRMGGTPQDRTFEFTIPRGADGKDGDPGAPGTPGKDGAPGKDGENGKSAYDYAVEGGFPGNEESFANTLAGIQVPAGSVLRPLYEAITPNLYNESTGFYEINGLTDLTEEQMPAIYNVTLAVINRTNIAYTFNNFNTARTIIPCFNIYGAEQIQNAGGLFYNSKAERVKMLRPAAVPDKQHMVKTSGMFYFARNASSLVWLGDIFDVSTAVGWIDAFYNCVKLETVYLYGVKDSFSFKDSPALGLESLRFLVEHAANTGAITITVHPDVYAKLADEGNADWHAVLTNGIAKKISFATV